MSGNISCMTYSPDGRIFQIEYAQKAVHNGETIIGVQCSDGIILGAEKQLFSPLLESTDSRILQLSKETGLILTGIVPDGKAVFRRAKEEQDNYVENYDVQMSAKIVSERIGQYMHAHTLYHSYRPFGCSLMVAGFNEFDGYSLNIIQHNGEVYKYKAYAMGRGRQIAKNHFEKHDFINLTCDQALIYISKILQHCFEEFKDKKFEIELATVQNKQFKKVEKEQIQTLYTRAKQLIEQEEQQ